MKSKFLVLEKSDKLHDRSGFHDELAGTTWLWPKKYDGRAIITDSFKDHSAGVSLEENQTKFKGAAEGDSSRQLIWS